MYSSIYRVQSSTRRLSIRALFGFTLKLVESYPSPSPQSLCVVVCPWCQPWVASSPHQTVSILSHALSLLAALLGLAPTMTFPMVKRELLSDIYQLCIPHSCLALRLTLFSRFSLADLQISAITHHTYALTDATIREDRPSSTAL